jgi:hypothetical protein
MLRMNIANNEFIDCNTGDFRRNRGNKQELKSEGKKNGFINHSAEKTDENNEFNGKCGK